MKHRTLLALIVVLLAGLAGMGCQRAKQKLSYAEALQVYNLEVQQLDRLQAQREALVKQMNPAGIEALAGKFLEHAAEAQAEMDGVLEDLEGAIGPLRDDKSAGKADTGPRSGKDRVIDAADGAIDAARAQLQAQQEKQVANRAALERQLQDLDQQIAAQQKKVDQALADKQAAEANR